jgi:hypothetical protein
VPATLEVCAAHKKLSARNTTPANDNLSHRIFTNENTAVLDPPSGAEEVEQTGLADKTGLTILGERGVSLRAGAFRGRYQMRRATGGEDVRFGEKSGTCFVQNEWEQG